MTLNGPMNSIDSDREAVAPGDTGRRIPEEYRPSIDELLLTAMQTEVTARHSDLSALPRIHRSAAPILSNAASLTEHSPGLPQDLTGCEGLREEPLCGSSS
jgi:hypothetical protein